MAKQPGTAAAVFIDGWNIHRGCERAFGSGQLHPLLLGRILAGTRSLAGVHYHIGIPDQRVEADGAARRKRQLDFMTETGVSVHPRKLQYRWEWKLDKRSLPHPSRHDGERLEAEATAKRQGREKGVDVALALNAYSAALDPRIDVVIVVSADRDLDLVAEMVRAHPDGAPARVENAVINPHGKKIINKKFSWSHQIDRKVFAQVRDDTDYGRRRKAAAVAEAVCEVVAR